jgi:carboxypeptidase C (cathepsin A)
MELNPYLKVFSASGYYDAVTPFFQTILNFENMALSSPHARGNLTIRNYPSGHMIYLDNESRSAMKADLAAFYEDARRPQAADQIRHNTALIRRVSRTPY